MTSASLPPIELFRPGTFTSAEGEECVFSLADCQAIAASYDPALFESPVVIGHPKMDAPAYGWVKALAIDDAGVITAETGDVDASFAEAVGAKRYRKVSASFWPKGSKASPNPDVPYLKHIGFLGAAAPAVKGLKPVHFSEAEQAECKTISFALQGATVEPIRTTPEEKTVPDKPEDRTQEFAERDTKLNDREAAIAAREAAADKAAADARHDASVSFAETLVAAGKLAPAGKDQVIFVLDALGETPDTLSFGEGDKAMKPAAAFRALFDGAKPVVSFGEIAKPDAKGDNADPTDIARRAQEFVESEAKAGRTVNIAAAVRHVEKAG